MSAISPLPAKVSPFNSKSESGFDQKHEAHVVTHSDLNYGASMESMLVFLCHVLPLAGKIWFDKSKQG
jgi:hypothetical protein